jgi:hypothetical protein
VVAFVDVAARLGESCVKLYDFWKAVQDAPGDIKAIKDDFDTISGVLQGLRGKQLDSSVMRILRSCESMIQV